MKPGESVLSSVMQNKTTSEIVFEHMKRDIITGHLQPGQRLVERELSERYHVSRTPLREALRDLVRAGFAITIPYRGVAVRTIGYEYARNIYDLRIGVEGLAAYLAAERASKDELGGLEASYAAIARAARAGQRDEVMLLNTRFHELIATATHNDLLVDKVQELWASVNLLRGISWIGNARTEKSSEEHRLILQALLRRDAPQAREAAERHIRSSWEAVATAFKHHRPQSEAHGAAAELMETAR